MDVTVLGTGIMGAGMARSLLRAGHRVRVWNRSPQKASPLAKDGATVAPSPQEAVRDADVVLTMLFDADAVLQVIGEVALPEDALWLQSSTIGLDGCRRAEQLAADRGLTMLDAPVLGTKAPAEQGTLVTLVSGDADAASRAQPVFDAIGSKTVDAGRRIGAATALKLVCNAWVATMTVSVGQSLAMAEGLGLDPGLFLETIEGSASDSAYAHLKGAAMLDGDYATAFAVDGAVKDLDLIVSAARVAGVPPDMLTAAYGRFRAASESGRGDQDMAAVYTALRSDRGAG